MKIQCSKIKVIFISILMGIIALGMTACTPDMSSGSYSYANLGPAQSTISGTIISMRPVQVSNNNRLGAVVGAAGGGIAGSMIGGGWRSNAAGALGGAVVGGLLGNAAQNRLSTQTAIEYIVKTKSGKLYTVVQGVNPPLSVGQRVYILMGNPGTQGMGTQARIIAAN